MYVDFILDSEDPCFEVRRRKTENPAFVLAIHGERPASGTVNVHLTHDQARSLASTILAAIYPETAAMAESLDAVVQ